MKKTSNKTLSLDWNECTARLVLIRAALTGIGDLDTAQEAKNRILEELEDFIEESNERWQ